MDEAKLNEDPRQEHGGIPEGPVMNPDDMADPFLPNPGLILILRLQRTKN
jgi:hypothetical protein